MTLTSGIQKAVSVSTDTIGKMKDNQAFRKTSDMASAGWEKTKQGANQAIDTIGPTMEKVKKYFVLSNQDNKCFNSVSS